MDCPKCTSPNDVTSLYCRNCGSHLHLDKKKKSSEAFRDKLLLAFIAIILVHLVSGNLMRNAVPDFMESKVWYLHAARIVLYYFFFFLPAFAIRDIKLRIAGIALASIITIYLVYTNYEFLTLFLATALYSN